MNDVGIDAEWQVIIGPRGVLQRDEAACTTRSRATRRTSPRASGRCASSYNEMNAEELTGGWDVVIVHDPQPAGDPPACPGQGEALGLALPHRPLDAEPGRRSTASCRSSRATTRRVFHMQQYVPGGDERRGRRRAHLPAGDRPAVAEEHGAVARGRRLRLRPVRHRRRPAADLPGVALRPVEGPDGRDRRLPRRSPRRCPTCSWRWSARWPPTTPRAGSSSTPRWLTPTATRTSRSSTT